MIQVLTYSGKEKGFEGKDTVINSLHDAWSLDEFDINIIDLSDERFWERQDSGIGCIDKINDFRSMSQILENSCKSKSIIFFPQNGEFKSNYWGDKQGYHERVELKDIIGRLQTENLKVLYEPIKALNIVYENTKTRLGERLLSAAFYFNGIAEDYALTCSEKSNKSTTVRMGKALLSTLKIGNYEELSLFLKAIGLMEERQDTPDWLEEVKMFDDEKQFDTIQENERFISQYQKGIDAAKEVLNRNQRYKSILYTNGDELVEVVFEILDNMLGCDLSHFVDQKKEDFNFEIGERIFIGEIKGVTPNVKKANVSQLDQHVQEYLDEHEEQQGRITALLIINHQRNKPICDREDIPEDQIRLAERNGSLIVETITLLKLFEKYLSGGKTQEECIDTLKDNTGLLQI